MMNSLNKIAIRNIEAIYEKINNCRLGVEQR